MNELSETQYNYKIFVKKVLNAVDIHANSILEKNNEIFRKLAKQFVLKQLSIFEGFALMDTNNNGSLSKIEFNIGLKNLDINLPEVDFLTLWRSFGKSADNKVGYLSFLSKFIEAKAVHFVKFEDTIDTLIKKFATLVKKVSTYLQIYFYVYIHICK